MSIRISGGLSYKAIHDHISFGARYLYSICRPRRRERSEAAGGVAQHRRDHEQQPAAEGHFVHETLLPFSYSLRGRVILSAFGDLQGYEEIVNIDLKLSET